MTRIAALKMPATGNDHYEIRIINAFIDIN